METTTNALDYAVQLLKDGCLSIDEDGQIWRHRVITNGYWIEVNPRRAENVGGKGYLRLSLQVGGKLRSVMAHRAIWAFLVGPIPPGMQINHKDLNKQNNRLANLEVVSGIENIRHSHANGRNKPWCNGGSGMWRGQPLVNDAKKTEIKGLRRGGMVFREISAATGVSMTHIQRICAGKEG